MIKNIGLSTSAKLHITSTSNVCIVACFWLHAYKSQLKSLCNGELAPSQHRRKFPDWAARYPTLKKGRKRTSSNLHLALERYYGDDNIPFCWRCGASNDSKASNETTKPAKRYKRRPVIPHDTVSSIVNSNTRIALIIRHHQKVTIIWPTMSLRTTAATRFESFNVYRTFYKKIGDHEIEANVLVPKGIKPGKRPVMIKWHGGGLVSTQETHTPTSRLC